MGDLAAITIDIDDAKVQAMFTDIVKRGGDPRPCYPKIVTVVHRSTAETFRQQGRPKKWKALSARTIAMRRKGKRGGGTLQVYGGGGQYMGSVSASGVKILQDTGQLMMSVSSKAAHTVIRMARHEVEIGTRREGATTHQKGRPGTKRVTQRVRAHRRRVKGRRKKVAVRAHSRDVTFGPIPKREFMLWQEADKRAVEYILCDFVVDGKK